MTGGQKQLQDVLFCGSPRWAGDAQLSRGVKHGDPCDKGSVVICDVKEGEWHSGTLFAVM